LGHEQRVTSLFARRSVTNLLRTCMARQTHRSGHLLSLWVESRRVGGADAVSVIFP
jgi:hypothetical protein